MMRGWQQGSLLDKYVLTRMNSSPGIRYKLQRAHRTSQRGWQCRYFCVYILLIEKQGFTNYLYCCPMK